MDAKVRLMKHTLLLLLMVMRERFWYSSVDVCSPAIISTGDVIIVPIRTAPLSATIIVTVIVRKEVP